MHGPAAVAALDAPQVAVLGAPWEPALPDEVAVLPDEGAAPPDEVAVPPGEMAGPVSFPAHSLERPGRAYPRATPRPTLSQPAA